MKNVFYFILCVGIASVLMGEKSLIEVNFLKADYHNNCDKEG